MNRSMPRKDQRQSTRPGAGSKALEIRKVTRPARPTDRSAALRRFIVGLAVAAVTCTVFVAFVGAPFTRLRHSDSVLPAAGHRVAGTYVGATTCGQCHAEALSAWRGSHHDQSMQVATPATVLGDFHDASIDHFGERTTFTTRADRFIVRTGGPDGSLVDYEIAYTFGVSPLQQYLVAFPGGRFQALPVAWDSRPATEGGQRWFHLYPDEEIHAGDQLHWTGPYQNWNMMCAECHSTNLRKGYDPRTKSYHTTFNEINVACEACHGPGSAHVEWARHVRPQHGRSEDRGLTVSLDSRWPTAWHFESSNARFPVRDRPASATTANICAACHSRRSEIVESASPGAPLEDSHSLATLSSPLYHPDGQQREEVYEWGSFLQSRMYQRGVTCMDCHDPHSLRTRGPGNALCARCHSPAIFDTSTHHHHSAGSAGAACTACHMPSQKYMVIHERLDHSIRVPRPDLSPMTGAPNACTMCHANRSSDWAAAAMDKWYTPKWRDRAQWGPVIAAASAEGAKAVPRLLSLARNAEAPALVRATAAEAAATYLRPDDLAQVFAILSDPDPSVRISALSLLEPHESQTRVAAAAPYLNDPVRGVRIAAARLLADIKPQDLSTEQSKALIMATSEYESALQLNADWPSERTNAGDLALRRGDLEDAVSAFRQAIELDPHFVGAYVNLADLYRAGGNEPEGERVLRRGLKLSPESPDLHHALGLLLTRKGDTRSALQSLGKASSLAPANPHYGYVYAIALQSAGDISEALNVLRAADKKRRFDPEILSGLVSMLDARDGPGDHPESLECAKRLAQCGLRRATFQSSHAPLDRSP